MMKKLPKSLWFYIITMLLTFLLTGIFHFAGGKYSNLSAMIFGFVYMFMPFAGVVIVEKIIYKEKKIFEGIKVFSRINVWYIIGWLLFPMLTGLVLWINLKIPGVEFSPDMSGIMEKFSQNMTPEQIEQMKKGMEALPFHPVWLSVIQGLIAGATINALVAFGEEIAWRGFLVRELKNLQFIKASVIIGIAWGLWHAPIILLGHNYPQHPVAGVGMMMVWCTLLSPLFLYFTLKGRSVLLACIMHGTLNATAGIPIMVIKGGNDLVNGVTGLAGFLALVIALVILFIADRTIIRERIFTIVERLNA